MTKNPQHKDIRVLSEFRIFPYSLGSYTSGWFKTVKIKKMYLEYDEDYGVWADCCFVNEKGEDMDSVEPRNWWKLSGRNPRPWQERPSFRCCAGPAAPPKKNAP